MIVIKFGGNALLHSSGNLWLDRVAEWQKRDTKLILTLGGGPQIDAELSLHGVARNFIEGYRFTDAKTMQIVEMVLSGIAQNLVRELRARNVSAVSISGNDGGLFEVSIKRSPSGRDLGQVGEVRDVNVRVINTLINEGFLPVITSISSTSEGVGVNVNADLAAGAIAGAISAEKVIFMTDVKGIYRRYPDEGSLIQSCSKSELEELLPEMSEGMIPKVEAVIQAIDRGAKSAQIIDGRTADALTLALQGDAVGTLVHHG